MSNRNSTSRTRFVTYRRGCLWNVAKFSSNWAGNKAQAWVCVAFMFVFMLSYGVSWSPIAWSLPSEVHTSSYRGKGVALATAVVWISNFAIVS